jgi:hypothetical protein
MSLFEPFRKATRPETPGFAAAEEAEGIFKQRAKQQENALRSGNMLGAAQLYNAGMGDRSPIADYLFDDPVADIAAGGTAESLGIADVGAAQMGADGAAMAGAVPTAAPTAMGAGTGAGTAMGAAGAALPASAAGAGTLGAGAAGGATAGAGAGSGALASLGPYGWAALAAMALLSMN